MKDKYEESEIIASVVDHILKYRITFPYKRLFMGKPHVMFERLKQFRGKFSNEKYNMSITIRSQGNSKRFVPLFNMSYLTIISELNDYERMDILGDYFNEPARLSAKRIDADKTPLECWKDPKIVTTIVKEAMKSGCITTYTLREAMYTAKIVEATQFKPSLVVATIRYLFKDGQPIDMLDISAGWGDRAIGALAAGVRRYLGYDPNTALKAGHDEIIKMFAGTTNIEIRYVPFEQPDESRNRETFNLVFTSPPFWNLEVYTKLPGQSIDTFSTYETWAKNFLFASLKIASGLLRPGGYMVIHISNLHNINIVEPMLLYMNGFVTNMRYLGVISSLAVGASQKHRPMWVWIKDMNSLPDEDSARELQKKYKSLCLQ
jgi:16S rRNA G966 N2-methylase RsmD